MLPLKRAADRTSEALGRLSSLVSFSVFEALAFAAALTALALAARGILRAIRHRPPLVAYLRGGLTICLVIGSALVALLYLWGVGFQVGTFEALAQPDAPDTSPAHLRKVTEGFVSLLESTPVRRAADGQVVFDRERLFDASAALYGTLEEAHPFLQAPALRPKALVASRGLSYLQTTGIYFPFTGEANINVDTPPALIPSTIAHELAHQRHIRSEKEANFLAVVACLESGDDDFVYSGALLATIYLLNAVYDVDRDAHASLWERLPEGARADLAAHSAYWQEFAGTAVAKASNKAYDSMLKTFGDDQGVQSYGQMVDLLLWYYASPAAFPSFGAVSDEGEACLAAAGKKP